MWKVVWSKHVDKQLDKVPGQIVKKFQAWVWAIEAVGMQEVRKSPGYHDEPLKGERKGQRSIRLNKAYRAIYREKRNGELEIVEILEVNKHEY